MSSRLTNRDTLRRHLAAAGRTPNKTLGQHFLLCEPPIDATLAALAGGPQAVTELGAGAGALTQRLLEHGFQVRAIERDAALAAALADIVPASQQERLEVRVGDLRRETWEWPESYQLVGNIPYNLSGLIIRRLTGLTSAPTKAVLLVQEEVAQRLIAAPPAMSLISLAVQLWGTAQRGPHVPASCFWPAPQVDSRLVILTPHADMPPLAEREALLHFARPFFQQRRKQLGGVLRRHYHLSEAEAATALTAANLTVDIRPQAVTLEQWRLLYQSAQPSGKTSPDQ